METLLYNALILLADEHDVTIEELKEERTLKDIGMTEQEFDDLFKNE